MTAPLVTRRGQTSSAAGKLVAPGDHEAVTKAARGVPNRTDTTLSFDDGTRTFTITPVSSAWSYYIAGRQYIKSAAESIVIPDTSGPHWIYYDGGTLSSVVNAAHAAVDDLIVNKVRIGIVYWNATDGAGHLVADERHGGEMPGACQEWWHDTTGAVWHDGLELSGYALDTDTDAGVDFEVTDGGIRDEDIVHDIVDGAPATQYAQQLNGGNAEIPIAYRDDVNGTWTQDAADTLPYKRFGAGRLAYNKDDGDGTWSQVEVTNNRFVLATLVATNDWQYPIKMVQGQAEYTDKKTAIEEANAEQVAWGTMITPEIVPLYRLVMETGDGLGGTNKCRIVAVTDLRRLSLTGGQAVPSEAHAILNGGTHSDSVAAAVVRGALPVGNATPAWDLFAPGAVGTFLRSAGAGADLAWDGTVITSAAVIGNNRLIRGDGGARGTQSSLAILSDAGELSALTALYVDSLKLDGATISLLGLGSLVLDIRAVDGGVRTLIAGSATNNRWAWTVENHAWNAVNADTRTAIGFHHVYNASGHLAEVARIAAGNEQDWSGTAADRDGYLAFSTILNGTIAEKVRISSGGIMGINTTTPGSNISTNLLDIRREGERCTMGMFTAHNTQAARGSSYYGGRSRGTLAAPTIVQNGAPPDTLFTFVALGYDGGVWRAAAQINFVVDGAPGVGAVPTSIHFRTGPTAATIADRFSIQSDGDILVDADSKMMFRDSNLLIYSSIDGQLDIFADTLTLFSTAEVRIGESAHLSFRDAAIYINSSADGWMNIVADALIAVATPILSLDAPILVVAGANGINYNPGADVDVDIVTVDVTGAPRFWWDESEDAFVMTHRLDLSAAGVQTQFAVDDVSAPPTDAELDAAFGDPEDVGTGFVGVLDDGGAGLYCYLVWTTGTNGEWFYVAGTKAV